MARSRSRRRSFGPKSRPVDWVTNGQTYGSTELLLDPNSGGEFIDLSLTGHADLEAEANARYPQLEQTAVTVKGQIFSLVLVDGSWWTTANGVCVVHYRIRKAMQIPAQFDSQEPDLGSLGIPNDTNHPTFAQEEFLWEHREIYYARSSWGDVEVPSEEFSPRVVNVNLQTQRRLKVGEVLVLLVSARTFAVNEIGPGTWPLVASWPYLRTLVRTIT